MRKIYVFILTGLLCAACAHANAQMETYCGTDAKRLEAIQNDPSILEREAAFNAFAAQFNIEQFRTEDNNYVIPVVFHIVHDYGPENISDDQIYNAMENINADYSKTNDDFDETVADFVGIAANCQIEFRLAQRQLSGTCTDGIDRIPSMLTYAAGDEAKLNGWQSGHYLNIWVVKSLPAGVAAYAYYPSSIGGLLYTVDGVICRYDYVGGIGAAGSYAKHVLSHEIGHYLNLAHVWGSTNAPGVACGDDNVYDTPLTMGWTTCNLAGNNCGELENVQNFMEYSYCETMFTEGQKERMYAALESEDAMRNNLWTEENLALTGTTDGYVAPLCTPKAAFTADSRFICAGSTATFHDKSWNGAVDSRTWNFAGGVPETSTETDPMVMFTEPGWHAVTLTATNDAGSNIATEEKYIFVSSSAPDLDKNYFGDFNDPEEVETNWALYNKYPDDQYWQWRGGNGYWNTGCIWLNSRNGVSGDKDAVVSPSFDLADGTANLLFFKYSNTSNAPDESGYNMSLKMYYSTNCGVTWIFFGQLYGDDLITSYGGGTDFYPQFPDQWRSANFNIPTPAKTANVKFKMEFNYGSYSNNLFIDDFNFTTGFLDVAEQTEAIRLIVGPNPVSAGDVLQVQYYTEVAGDLYLEISDITGKRIAHKPLPDNGAGSHAVLLSPADYGLQSGCYLLTLSNGSAAVHTRIVVF
ncbi:MAG: M43 family zinc metalloprotease [Chitinophagales bacterium]